MPLEKFTRVIGHIECGDTVIPWEFVGDSSLLKLVLLVAEHARLSGADEQGVKVALME